MILKRLRIGLAVALFAGVQGGAALAEGAHVAIVDSVPTVNVRGEGKVSTKPDEATVMFGVTTEDPKLKQAYQKHTEDMNRVTKTVKSLGIKDEDIQTSTYTVQPVYSDQKRTFGTQLRPVGYRLQHQLTVKIRDLSRMGEVIDRAMEEDITSFGGIQFGSSRQKELETEAKRLAASDAKKQAELIASGLGAKVGRVLKADFAEYSPRPMMLRAAMAFDAAAESGPPQIESGSMDVMATCNAVFQIE